ncbi:PQ-loop-domain-containing protein [Durotheca rogersii]|uniref:PQ-loop-domain-containing protein n=1 Tax=Durotheca rogersii TaxID=419775 RepID=UPI00221F62D6|nr:PQ-loop-domain-containing protein [Durotheca rogersii]KAI5868172.1 PQ-loop-domain-containing protein [Durotheca rogersii]
MAPPTGPLNLDVEAISGICGSISIAAWVVVFSPQIVENFRRGSAEGLSVPFVALWLLGDVFNIIGALLQRVLPTMVVLAVYYTVADLVLLAQCFYYRRSATAASKNLSPTTPKPEPNGRNGNLEARGGGQTRGDRPTERTALLLTGKDYPDERQRRDSGWSHLSPAVPLVSEQASAPPPPPPTRLQSAIWNSVAVLMVCGAGVLGWALSQGRSSPSAPSQPGEDPPAAALPTFDLWGQVFGWLCAALYLGSRVPQLLLNWRRRSTEGVSVLFFLFACVGNLTYVLSILAYEPPAGAGPAGDVYARYVLVNLSWLAGSAGTLLLDLCIFAQFFAYGDSGGSSTAGDGEEGWGEREGRRDEDAEEEDEFEVEEDDDDYDYDERLDDTPLLQRTGSGMS